MTRRTFIVPSIADCVFILALLIVTLVWARPALNTDGDAGRHIRVGETILQRGGLFYEDLFSHTMAGERFVPYEWGSETLTALAHRAGGLPGVVILHGLVVAVAWFLLALFLRRRGVDHVPRCDPRPRRSTSRRIRRDHVPRSRIRAIRNWPRSDRGATR